jgi:hypothetical protein
MTEYSSLKKYYKETMKDNPCGINQVYFKQDCLASLEKGLITAAQCETLLSSINWGAST